MQKSLFARKNLNNQNNSALLNMLVKYGSVKILTLLRSWILNFFRNIQLINMKKSTYMYMVYRDMDIIDWK